jgi:hypothetical protein
MTKYFENAEGQRFLDLTDNGDFQRDLVTFFSGSRYRMSPQEIEEAGPTELARRFVSHMRWQGTNEYTALQDLNYVRNREGTSERELEAFGGLITAFDRSDGGGTGVFRGAADYLSAVAASPSTLATVATGGWGVGSKLAARAAGTSAQAAVRSQIADLVHRQVANDVIQNTIAGTVRQGAIRGGIASAGVEGAIGGALGYMGGEIRETTTGQEYTPSDLMRDAAISATIGGAIGSGARALSVSDQRRLIDSFASRESAAMQAREASQRAATQTLSSAPEAAKDAATERAVELTNILVARDAQARLDPLDPELVARGDDIRRGLFSGVTPNENLTPSLSMDTLRGVTAASLEIANELNIQPNERITSAVARAISDGRLTPQRLNEIRDTYGLSREELSLVYLSDLSQAGRTLAEASAISRAARNSGTTEAAQRQMVEITNDVGRLADVGLSTLDDKAMARMVADTYKPDSIPGSIMNIARESDGLRIAMMTSQVGTTMANNVTSMSNVVVDISDQFWRNVIGVTFGRQVGDQVQRNWIGGTLSTLKGMTLDRGDAMITRGLLEEAFPVTYRNTFFEAGRPEAAMEGMSRMARVGRFVNTFNSASDSVFKQATFYSGLDRGIRGFDVPLVLKNQAGEDVAVRNIGDFLATGQRLDSLPQDIVDRAVSDARRFTFQRSYQGDPSAFGTIAASVETAHRKLPFVVSSGLGIPFPRYVANHLEYINDYTPIGLATAGLNRLDNVMFGDKFKTGQDRFARQLTGASLVMLGYYTAAASEGDVNYRNIDTATGELDTGRVLSPFVANFFIGDLVYRHQNNLPWPSNFGREVKEIAGGMGDLGLRTDFLEAITESVRQGEFTEEMRRYLGDVASTFTYPLTIFRDMQGMLNPDAAPTPYTREVFGGSLTEPSTYGATGNYLEDIARRATRFLPDYDMLQYTQTFNGANDIPYYSIWEETPIGAQNPLSKQLGFRTSPRSNEIRQELSRLNLKDFDLYSRRTIPNATVAWVVEARLSQELNGRFNLWRSEVVQDGVYAGQTYDQIEDVNERRALFTSFVNNEIRREVDTAQAAFENLMRDHPRAAAGYIRNMYILEERTLANASNQEDIYDRGVAQFTDFDTALDFLRDSDTIEDELARRQQIMAWARVMTGSGTFLGEERR